MKCYITFVTLELCRTNVSHTMPYFLILHILIKHHICTSAIYFQEKSNVIHDKTSYYTPQYFLGKIILKLLLRKYTII